MRTDKTFNRQLGRNAQHYAEALAGLDTAEARYPHLRTLVGVIEQSRPEWITVARKEELFTELIHQLGADVPTDEVGHAIRARDLEFKLAAEASKTPKEATDAERAAGASSDKPKTAARAQTDSAANPAEPDTPINQADAQTAEDTSGEEE
jgi:hypothetical protein